LDGVTFTAGDHGHAFDVEFFRAALHRLQGLVRHVIEIDAALAFTSVDAGSAAVGEGVAGLSWAGKFCTAASMAIAVKISSPYEKFCLGSCFLPSVVTVLICRSAFR